MDEKVFEDSQAYKTCPFCGADIDGMDYDEGAAYADDQVHIDWYVCPECGARAQVRYVFEDITWMQ